MYKLKSIAKRMWFAFGHLDAWVLVLLGLGMFTARIPLPPDTFFNLPHAATVVQTAGLMFAMFGFQLMASMFMWPSVSFIRCVDQAIGGNSAAGYVVAGLLIFNGLCMVAFTLWLTGAFNLGVGAR